MMRYLSVCSGIEAATVAWNPLGWRPAAFSEIEPFPSAVLAHHYPDTPNLGDLTAYRSWPDADVDLLVGGTPCQSFSVAGLRKGLDDPRGNLALVYLGVADRFRPRWVVWENVPGVLSSNKGRDFGAFLGGLGELGYGWAYRVLDAQFVRTCGFPHAVPQRRRRVFVVGYLGDWRRAAAVLFDRQSLRGDPAPRRQAGQRPAPTLASRTRGGGGLGTDFDLDGGLISMAHGQAGAEIAQGYGPTLTCNHEAPIVAHALRAEGFDASEDGTGRGDSHNLEYRTDGTSNAILTPNGGRAGIGVGAVAFDTTQITSASNYSNPKPGDPCHPLAAGAHPPAIAFGWQNSASQGASASAEITPTLDKSKTPAVAFNNTGHGWWDSAAAAATVRKGDDVGGGGARESTVVALPWAVRRLTPTECERLQGFPDGYTQVPYRGKPASDGPRYKALGNSMAVNVMQWIGERIALVSALDDAA